jgi:uncharacterized damage-inducible protein DinB
MSNIRLIEESIKVLEALASLIANISDSNYKKIPEDTFRSSIGAHTRHVIEHYQMFFQGFDQDLVDYDQRQRNIELEDNRTQAVESITELVSRFHQLTVEDKPLNVVLDLGSSIIEAVNSKSTVARELAFLHSHATHHHAIIAMICSTFNLSVPPADFGLAPATRRYQYAEQLAKSEISGSK